MRPPLEHAARLASAGTFRLCPAAGPRVKRQLAASVRVRGPASCAVHACRGDQAVLTT